MAVDELQQESDAKRVSRAKSNEDLGDMYAKAFDKHLEMNQILGAWTSLFKTVTETMSTREPKPENVRWVDFLKDMAGSDSLELEFPQVFLSKEMEPTEVIMQLSSHVMAFRSKVAKAGKHAEHSGKVTARKQGHAAKMDAKLRKKVDEAFAPPEEIEQTNNLKKLLGWPQSGCHVSQHKRVSAYFSVISDRCIVL